MALGIISEYRNFKIIKKTDNTELMYYELPFKIYL